MGLEEQIKEMIKDRATEAGEKIGEKRGIMKGQTELKEKFAQKLINNFGYTDQQVADFIEVPLNFVKRLRKQKSILT